MPKYRVVIEETAVYECTVTARDAAAAEKKAELSFLGKNGIRVGCSFTTDVTDRTVTAEEERK